MVGLGGSFKSGENNFMLTEDMEEYLIAMNTETYGCLEDQDQLKITEPGRKKKNIAYAATWKN